MATAEGRPTVGRKPESKTVSLRTETAYKADGSGKAAPHAKAQGSDPEVNAEVVQWQFAFLSGEICLLCDVYSLTNPGGHRVTKSFQAEGLKIIIQVVQHSGHRGNAIAQVGRSQQRP